MLETVPNKNHCQKVQKILQNFNFEILGDARFFFSELFNISNKYKLNHIAKKRYSFGITPSSRSICLRKYISKVSVQQQKTVQV